MVEADETTPKVDPGRGELGSARVLTGGAAHSWKQQRRAEVSCIVLTDWLSPESAVWFTRVSELVDELLIFVDVERASAETRQLARRVATRMLETTTRGFIEAQLKEMVEACRGEWVLRLDSDEELTPSWYQQPWRELLCKIDHTHFKLPRRWVSSSGSFIGVEPWWPDPQMRLFRNDPSLLQFPQSIHQPTRVAGAEGYLRHLIIDHHVLRLLTRQQREEKARHYRKLRPEFPLADYYLYEEFSPPTIDTLGSVEGILSDSLIPMFPLQPSECSRISLAAHSMNAAIEAGRLFWQNVKVRNGTTQVLSSSAPFPVHLTYHWNDRSGRTVIFEGMRTEFFPWLAPGASSDFMMRVLAPDKPGEYTLHITMVQEYVRWFDAVDPAVACELDVTVFA